MFEVKKISKKKFYFLQTLGVLVALLTFIGIYYLMTEIMGLSSEIIVSILGGSVLVLIQAVVIGIQISYKKSFPEEFIEKSHQILETSIFKTLIKGFVLLLFTIISYFLVINYSFTEFEPIKCIVFLLIFIISYFFLYRNLKSSVVLMKIL